MSLVKILYINGDEKNCDMCNRENKRPVVHFDTLSKEVVLLCIDCIKDILKRMEK